MIAVQRATQEDIPSIVHLLNQAYRGDSSRKGWTTEADLIEGTIRSDAAHVAETMALPGSVFLLAREGDHLRGCVNLQQQKDRIYLGMFAVDPDLQGKGIGKILLAAADDHALALGCPVIYMTVISVRQELIDWYKRHGYADTGARKPFPEDGLTGKHTRKLEFSVLEKTLPG